ncbi:MAG: 4Fe-4S binding protein [Planctomycetes bacterium]|nr:4Fe-4S binding protein [Planctomycetota bacterium]
MPHYITDRCIGCTVCAKKCPVDCIAGENKHLHIIDPEICVDCGVCESYCPVEAIANDLGEILPKCGGQSTRPVAMVEEDLCSGCEFCVAACPFDCLDMNWSHSDSFRHEGGSDWFPVAEMVHAKECVGCRLCEEVCIKSAIVVRWPDGRSAPTFHVNFDENAEAVDSFSHGIR